MINKNLDEITKDDLQALIDNEVLENKTIEYKQTLPDNSDADKKEFLADVSSFANASGGDIIYGITEDNTTGKPKSLDGLDIGNPDQEILRLENIIRTGIQERLPSVNIQAIPIEDSRVALLIRVLKSWISPHRVILGGHDKFYSRNSSGKYPLDVGELRAAFNLSETITERTRNFRTDRIAKILANETPVPFYDTAKIALHLIPIISFNPAQHYDINVIASHPEKMTPMHSSGWYYRYNLDGFLNYSQYPKGLSYSYVQLFRNGIIEAVDISSLYSSNAKLKIYTDYEKHLIESLTQYIAVLKELNVEPPVLIFLTLINVKGYSMAIDTWTHDIDELYAIDRDILALPEIIIENYDEKPEVILKPSFDSIWNACGFKQSFNYNEAGEWAPS